MGSSTCRVICLKFRSEVESGWSGVSDNSSTDSECAILETSSVKLGVWPTMYLIVPGPVECQQKRIVVLNPSFHNHKKRFTFVACSTCHIRQLPQSPAEWGLRYEENQKVPQESTGSRSLSKFCKHRRSSWAELRVLIGSSQIQLRTYPWQFFSRIQPFAPFFLSLLLTIDTAKYRYVLYRGSNWVEDP